MERGWRRILLRGVPSDGGNSRPNFTLKLTAGRSPLPGLKPLFSPETHGVTPLADASESNAASGVPLCPPARGASLQLSVRSVSQNDGRVAPHGTPVVAERTRRAAKLQRRGLPPALHQSAVWLTGSRTRARSECPAGNRKPTSCASAAGHSSPPDRHIGTPRAAAITLCARRAAASCAGTTCTCCGVMTTERRGQMNASPRPPTKQPRACRSSLP